MIRIGRVKEEDVPAILSLVKNANLSNDNAVFMVVEVEGVVVGAGGIEIRGDDGWLSPVVIALDYRRQRLGDALVRAILNIAQHQGVEDIYVHIPRDTSEGFFTQLGFVFCECGHLTDESTPQDTITMHLNLKGYFICKQVFPNHQRP